MNGRRLQVGLALWTLLLASQAGGGEELVPLPTLGGKQFWADEFFFHQWRIQRNVFSDQCRLLDGSDVRHASGTYLECRQAMDKIRQSQNLPPMRGKAVVVLHGLGRSRSSMDRMCRYLQETGGYTVFNVSYPSTRHDVATHAQSLACVIRSLEGIEEINFVCHSLGNIVVRHYLADQTDPARGRRPDRRLHRFVMLGPPNHGSELAAALSDNSVFATVVGQSALELGQQWEQLQRKLATPSFEFGIIAGGRQDGHGYNPLLTGDNDAVVTVSGTRLAGAADFLIVPAMHTYLMDDDKVQQCTLRFLQHGFFVSAAERQPVR